MKVDQACFAATNFLDEHFRPCYEKQDDVDSGYRSMDMPEFDDGACENDEDIGPVQEERKLPKMPSENSDTYNPIQSPMESTG